MTTPLPSLIGWAPVGATTAPPIEVLPAGHAAGQYALFFTMVQHSLGSGNVNLSLSGGGISYLTITNNNATGAGQRTIVSNGIGAVFRSNGSSPVLATPTASVGGNPVLDIHLAVKRIDA